jgi:hypothetical protein
VTNQKYFSEEVMGFLANVKIGTKMLGEVSIVFNTRRPLSWHQLANPAAC